MMNPLQLQPNEVVHDNNPWRSYPSPSEGHLRGEEESAFQDSTLVSSQPTPRRDHDMILSPSPPPQPAQQMASQPPPVQGTDTTQPDPRIASLKTIFPDFDDAVILSVLESADNDHDRTLDMLLGMNDPSFVPSASPPHRQTSSNSPQSDPSLYARRQTSQEALDEQFARMLAFEEQQAAAQARAQEDGMGYIMYQPYQTRRGGRPDRTNRSSQNQPQAQGQGGKDTMTEFQEGFSRIAESGKKTFSSIVSKVKAKMQEFEQGQGKSGSQNPPPGQASQAPPAPYAAPARQEDGQDESYATPQRRTSQSRPSWTNSYSSSPPRSGVLRPAVTEPAQQPSYYDPNTRGYDLYGDDEDEIQIVDKTTPSTPAPVPAPTSTSSTPATPAAAPPPPISTQNPATSLHTENPSTPPPPSASSSSLPPYTSPALSPTSTGTSARPTSPPARSLSPTMIGAKSTTPGAPGGVDFSKLGLLPKRPISLVQPQSGHTAGVDVNTNPARLSVAHSESTLASPVDRREEPEFVENPFEDR